MKAARFYARHKLLVEDIPERAPMDNEVKIRVRYCGICGTDVHIYEGDKGSAEVTPPVTLGHEFSGDIVALGGGVTAFRPGDRVSVDPNAYCGRCYFCRNGKKQLCEHMIGLGTVADGGFAEYVTVPQELVFPIADNVSYRAAAMTEPLSCCLHGMDLTGVEIGDTVMVIGAGNIGQMMIQLARHAGAYRIIAVEPNPARLRMAEKFGADILIDPSSDDTAAVLAKHAVGCVNKVIDCAGRTNTAEYAIEHAGRGATVMIYGLTAPDEEMRLKPYTLFQKELTVKGAFVNPDTFERAGRLLARGIVNVEDMITDIVDLSDIASAFENRLYAKNGKVLIRCSAD